MFFVLGSVWTMGSADASALPQATLRFSSVQAFVKSLFADAVGLPGQASGTASGRGGDVSAKGTRAGTGSGHAPGTAKGELPAYNPSPKRVASGKSGLIHKGFDAKTSTRNARKSTAFSDYFDNADGSYTVKTSMASVNYKATDGTWQPIDATLVHGSDGQLHQRANGIGVSFAGGQSMAGASVRLRSLAPDGVPIAAASPSRAASSSGSAGQLVSLSLGSGESLAWSLQGAAAVTPSVTGATAQYDGILPETNLSLTSEDWGVKEAWTLSSASAPNSWSFPLALSGVSLRDDPAYGWELVDASGSVVGRLSVPFAYDSVTVNAQHPNTSFAVTYSLSTDSSGAQSLVMTLDRSWLDDPARVFPVTVDPTVTVGDPGVRASTYIEYPFSNNYSSTGQLLSGFSDWGSPTVKARSFIYFDTMPVASGYHVTQANVGIFDIWAATCSAEPFDVYPVTDPNWTASSIDTQLTWTNTAYTGPSVGSSMGEVSAAPGAACTNNNGTPTTGTWMLPQLNVSVVNQWTATNPGAYHGIEIAAPSESNDLEWKIFDSTAISSNSPYIYITYSQNVAPQVNSTSPASGFSSATLTPTLTANASDPDNWPGLGLGYEYQVFDGANNTKVYDSQPGATCGGGTAPSAGASWTVPSGVLKWGQSYYWSVAACDHYAWSSWAASSSLVTAVPPPLLTDGLSQDSSGRGFDPGLGNYTTSETDAKVATVGPALALTRDYNSLDPRTSQALGAGWSSILDSRAAEQYDTAGHVTSVTVTYPDGSEVGYGRNADGSFAPPLGRFATFTAASGGGYTLTDKNDTVYTFTQALGSGVYGISSVADAAGRTLSFGWSTGEITTMTSASGRALHLVWSTPSGAAFAHVSTVTTDPATAGNGSTASVWKYFYAGDELASVCDPVQSGSCTGAASDVSTKYSYTSGSQYRSAVLDGAPRAYWPLGEASGTIGADGVLANQHSLDATYTNVALGGAGGLAGSAATAAVFNGSSSQAAVSASPPVLNTASSFSVSAWVKLNTTSSWGEVVTQDGTQDSGFFLEYAQPDGKWAFSRTSSDSGSAAVTRAESSVAPVAGAWTHLVGVYDANLGTLTLYVNGVASAPVSYTGAWSATGPLVIGRNLWAGTKGGWLSGSVSDVSVYQNALPAATVAGLYRVGTQATPLLTKITRPTGAVAAQIAYSTVTGRVSQVTDNNGGVWQVGNPSVSGSAEGYRAAVLGAAPSGYWRLGDAAGSASAYNEVAADGQSALYNNVTLGAAPGPMTSPTAGAFDGSTSYVSLPQAAVPLGTAASVALWFNTSHSPGVLFEYQSKPLGQAGAGSGSTNYVNVYIGTDGKLHGGFFTVNGVPEMASSQTVTDGKWHQVVLTATTGSGATQTLYLDGKQVAQLPGANFASIAAGSQIYLGAGTSGTGWSALPDLTDEYFNGDIAEAAFFQSALLGPDVADIYNAAKDTAGLNPTETVTVTDPNTHQLAYEYDPVNGGRMIAQIDVSGAKTTYGYDSGGFVHTVVDPDGDETITGHDPRGNTVSKTTCQVQATNSCSTAYYTYYPDDTTAILTTADARNDLMLTASDARSSSNTDATYRTTYGYDTRGDRTSQTTPPAPGYPSGRTATTTYADGTAAFPAADGGNLPAGLPVMTVSAAGAVTLTSYFHNGDIAATRTPDGLVTRFTYDGLGRMLTKTVAPGTPTAWWQLNQTTGTTVPDASGTGNTGTASNVSWSGGVGVFNGTSSQITASSAAVNTSASFTVSAWVNLAAIPTGRANVATWTGVDQESAYLQYSPYSKSWAFQMTSADVPYNSAAPTYYTAAASGPPTTGVWTHLVAVYNASTQTVQLYVNNALAGSASVGTSWAASTLAIGSANGQYYFNGSIANVQMYQRALSASEVTGLYNAGYTGATVATPTPNGLVTQYTYDGLDRVSQESDPATTDVVTGAVHTPTIVSVYDADGNLTSTTVSDPTGGDAARTTTRVYNSMDQLQSTTDPAQVTTSYTYNPLGLKATMQDAVGNVTAYTYDGDGRLTYTTLKNYTGSPSGSQSAADLVEEARTYDPAGQLASVTDAMGYATLYQYTDNGLTAKVTRCSAMTVTGGVPSCAGSSYVQQSSTYDGAGNQTKTVTNNGTTETDTVYDAAGRDTSTTLDPHGLSRTTSKSYTPDDFVASQTTGDANGSATTDYTYTPAGVMTSQSVENYATGAPTGWWKLNDGTPGTSTPSTARDWSGQNNTGTLSSGTTWAPAAASFNGTSGVINTAGPVLNTTASFSVSAWVNLAVLAPANGPNEEVASQDGSQDSAFMFGYHPASQAWWMYDPDGDSGTPGGPTMVTASNTAQAGTWTHLVAVYNASAGTMSLYINGALGASTTVTTQFNATGAFAIGRALYGGKTTDFFNGQIANMQAYPRALSATDISTLYNNGYTGGALSASSNTTTWQVDPRGLATSMTDPDGNTTSYVYDAAGRKVQAIAPTVTTGTYSTSAGTYSTAVVAPVTSAGYNSFGEVAEAKDPDGNTTVYTYDADGRQTAATAPSYTQPGTSNHATIAGAKTVTHYNSLGEVDKSWDAAQAETDYAYDQLGHQTSTTFDPTGLNRTASAVYDADGDVLKTTDPTGAIQASTYDYLGRQLTATQVLGIGGSGSSQIPSGCQTYNNVATQAACTTTSQYTDTAGLLSQATSPAGVSTGYAYDAAGERTSVTDAANQTTTTDYDYAGRTVKTTAPDGTYSTTAYDPAGQATATSQYDASGALLHTATAAYDGDGNLLSSTDGDANALIAQGKTGYSTTYTYDATGLLQSETQPLSATSSITTSFGYDAAGHQTRYVTGNNNAWYTTYNPWGLPESQIEPTTATYTTAAASTFTTVYDTDARPIEQDAPGGVTALKSYDTAGEALTQSGTGAEAATATRSFTYYNNGLVKTAATSNTATTGSNATGESFAYDDSGALTTASGSAGTSAFTYTADGQMASRTDTDEGTSHAASYGYDAAGRLSTINDPLTGSTLTYQYTPDSLNYTITYGAGGDVRSLAYDSAHELASDTLKAGTTTVASIAYGYDPNGNETAKTTTGFTGAAANTYTYDEANRLTSWTSGSTTTAYSYDADNNRTQAGANVFTYDARDQLTSDGVTSYAYTARGTLQSSTSTGRGAVATTADAYNQIQSDGADTYTYDALGRVTQNGATALTYTGLGNTLSYDGATAYTRDPTGNLIASAQGSNTQLAWTDQHTDNVASFTPTGTGLSGSTAYDPLGQVLSKTGYQTNLGYQSEYTSPATGKVDMAARWYNPKTGQFTSKDTTANNPVPDSANTNPFAYAGDNPLTGTDPTGHTSCMHIDSADAPCLSQQNKDPNYWAKVDQASNEQGLRDSVGFDSNSAVIGTYASLQDDLCGSRFGCWTHRMRALSTIKVDTHGHIVGGDPAAIAGLQTAAAMLNPPPQHPRANCGWNPSSWLGCAKNFAADHPNIAGVIAGIATFAGCALATGVETGGLSLAACGAAAGAVGSMVTHWGQCSSGSSSNCSVGSYLEAGAIGGVAALATAGVAGAVGGLVGDAAESVFGTGLTSRIVGGAITGGLGGAAGGALGGGLNYAADCGSSAAGCSWSGLGHAAAGGAVAGAVGGAIVGGVLPLAGSSIARLSPELDQNSAAGQLACNAIGAAAGAVAPHSFTGTTPVLMADGTTKPIDQVKIGDQIANSVPGQTGTQSTAVTNVIITKTDHDFVNLDIEPLPLGAKATATAVPAQSLAKSVLKKAAVGLAATLTAITTSTAAAHATDATAISRSAVTVSADAAQHGGTLTTTFHHPFYDITQAAFVDAQNLKSGDRLQTPTGYAVVTSVHLYHANTITYDLTISALHTYYVVAGDTPVLVHNCGDARFVVDSNGTATDLRAPLFRADDRHPNEIFGSGFQPKGGNLNIDDHVYSNPEDSGFISTSKTEAAARQFANDNYMDTGYVYKLRGSGIDVNERFGNASPYPWEKEIAVPGPIEPHNIEGAWSIETSEWFANPGWRE
jgi:RHS repeat-associated protein